MGRIDRLEFYLLASDPGRVALRLSVRVVLTLAAVCLVLIVLDRWIHLPEAAFTLGMISAVQGAAQIRDPTIAGRALTRLYAAIAGFVAIAAIWLVERSLLRIDVVLLAIVFLATYARRFGSRWQAVGVFAFMCAVVGAFLKAPETQLLDIAIALAISGFTAHLVRNFVMPEDPHQDFLSVVSATLSLSQRLRNAIGEARGTAFEGHNDVLMIADRLRNAIVMCEGYIPLQAERDEDGVAAQTAFRFLDLQLAAETAVELSLPASTTTDGSEIGRVQQALEGMREAESAIRTAVETLPESFPRPAVAKPEKAEIRLFPRRGEWLRDEALRLSLQVTLACAIAMVVGEALSSQRWFWAVMTAFLIFMNTQSGGAVALKAVNRAMGTAAGISVGIALATLIHGNAYLTIPLVAVSIFMSFYLLRISYAGMNIFLNIAISLIYGYVGIFTPELLVLRLEETAVGAAAGTLVALMVLPVDTVRRAQEALNKLTNALLGVIDTIVEGAQANTARAVAASVSAVDNAFSDVLTAFEPLRNTWTFGRADVNASEGMREAYLMVHAAHLLERGFRDGRPNGDEDRTLRLMRDRLQATMRRDDGTPSPHPSEPLDAVRIERSGTEAGDASVRYAVETLWVLLQHLEDGGFGRGASRARLEDRAAGA